MRGPLHEKLREATADAHHALERDLDWVERIATRDGYCGLLADLRGFHAAYEAAIGRALADEVFFGPRRRLDQLDADLIDMGMGRSAILALPTPQVLALSTVPAGLGALYVLEGSRLGGQVICREVEQRLALAGVGTRYYYGYGGDTGRMWRNYLARLESIGGDVTAEGDVLDTGVATFQALAEWLSEASRRAAA